ncbi:hypothetical protein EBZ35_06225 [bacterium]|nr:hypothetical protein [bacterium]
MVDDHPTTDDTTAHVRRLNWIHPAGLFVPLSQYDYLVGITNQGNPGVAGIGSGRCDGYERGRMGALHDAGEVPSLTFRL